jgi:hypothetical protein
VGSCAIDIALKINKSNARHTSLQRTDLRIGNLGDLGY